LERAADLVEVLERLERRPHLAEMALEAAAPDGEGVVGVAGGVAVGAAVADERDAMARRLQLLDDIGLADAAGAAAVALDEGEDRAEAALGQELEAVREDAGRGRGDAGEDVVDVVGEAVRGDGERDGAPG